MPSNLKREPLCYPAPRNMKLWTDTSPVVAQVWRGFAVGTRGCLAGCRGMTSGSTSTSAIRVCSLLLSAVLAFAWVSPSAAAPPNLVPRGWKHDAASSDRRTIHFTSPDGRATLTMRDFRATDASPPTAIARKPGEQVTYQTRGRSWWVLSGYRGNNIFYRRADFACARHRVHVIELVYPRDQKRQFDALVTSISHRLESYRDVCSRR